MFHLMNDIFIFCSLLPIVQGRVVQLVACRPHAAPERLVCGPRLPLSCFSPHFSNYSSSNQRLWAPAPSGFCFLHPLKSSMVQPTVLWKPMACGTSIAQCSGGACVQGAEGAANAPAPMYLVQQGLESMLDAEEESLWHAAPIGVVPVACGPTGVASLMCSSQGM